MTGTTSDTTTTSETTTTTTTMPTYNWALGTGAASSIIGLVLIAMCITASVMHSGPAGYAPIPSGTTAFACCMTLGGLVLLLFRILHADREELMRRLVAMDRKLNNVWGIAAVTSIEAQPPQVVTSQQQHTRRRGRRTRGAASAEDSAPLPDNVRRLRKPNARHVEALKRIAEQIVDPPRE